MRKARPQGAGGWCEITLEWGRAFPVGGAGGGSGKRMRCQGTEVGQNATAQAQGHRVWQVGAGRLVRCGEGMSEL